MKGLIELRDLYRRQQLDELVAPLQHPGARVTCYGRPNLTGDIRAWREGFPWVTFGMQGFEGVAFECANWTEERAEACIQQGLDLGYDRLFLPPNWAYDDGTEAACKKLDVVFRNHPSVAKMLPGLRTFPGPRGGRGGRSSCT